jgi:FkbM family methyltransferase
MSNLVQKKIDKFLMNLDLEDGGISLPLFQSGAREKAFMSILKAAVKPNDVCVDLGANIGYTTLFMLDEVGDNGFVYAIEPDGHNIEILEANILSNNFSEIVSVDKCAISSEDGVLDFWIASQPNLNSVKKTKHSIRKEEIPCYTLNTFLEDKKYPNFIKMDVEGHEVKIFEGGLDYFSENKGRTSFLVEVHPHFYDKDNDFSKVLKEYFKIGFNCTAVVSTPIPQPSLYRENGYSPAKTVYTDGFMRGIYTDIENDDMIEFTCKPHHEAGSKKIARSFMITREE